MATAFAPIGPDTLERIARTPTDGHPVLSVYVDLDPARFPTPAERETQISALLGNARRESAGEDADRVERLVYADRDTLRETGALAIFSSAGADMLEAVHLPYAVEPMAVVDSVPWLEPMAAMASTEEWGVAVVSRTTARLLRGGVNGLTEYATLDDEVHRQHQQGGWSQARFQRGIEEQVGWHVRRVAEMLLRAHERRAFDHLVVACTPELRPVLHGALHASLTQVLRDGIGQDLQTAPLREIEAAVRPVIERTEQERIDCLLLTETKPLRAARCPQCGRLSADPAQTCPGDGATLAAVDGAEHLVDEAALRGAKVAVIRREPERVDVHGGVAALLRW
jgi:peptide chain release factor subunit 1